MPSTTVSSLARSLRDEARQHYRSGRVVLAVDGPDGGGQAALADGLAAAFAASGTTAFRAPAAVSDGPEGARVDTLRRDLVAPFRAGEAVGRPVTVAEDGEESPHDGPDAVLVVDGTRLHAADVRGLWNWSLWLEVAPAVAAARVAERDGTDPDPAAESNRAAREGFQRYVREARPRQAASAIVENSDAAHPVQIFGDFC
ncbi:uridine kinase [Microbacterium sp. LMI1-1-1.1]|uniref:uridine kinase n=1 Tax=Microbacterium sp. LMI1-1-1.1 TaxID=3135223 RepID=UPI0034657A17